VTRLRASVVTDLGAASRAEIGGIANPRSLARPGPERRCSRAPFPSLLPDLPSDAALEVAAIYSLRGTLRERPPTRVRPPFRAPHHSISRAGLVGGGTGLAQPTLISLGGLRGGCINDGRGSSCGASTSPRRLAWRGKQDVCVDTSGLSATPRGASDHRWPAAASVVCELSWANSPVILRFLTR